MTEKTYICKKNINNSVKNGEKLKVVNRSPEGWWWGGGILFLGAQLQNIRAEAKGLVIRLWCSMKHKQLTETGGERTVQRVCSDRALLNNLLISHIPRISSIFQLSTRTLKVCLLRFL